MKVLNLPAGIFHVWDVDQAAAVVAGGGWWDWPIKPAIDAAAERCPQGWALDLGAAFGWFTVYLARKFAQVLAVEAHPDTFTSCLLPTIDANGLLNVVPRWWAAFDRSAYFILAPPGHHGWPTDTPSEQQPNMSSLGYVPAVRGGAPGAVLGGPVDSLVPRDAQVALIKVDVQGADLRALKGLRQTIARCRPTVCWEFEGGASGWHGDTLQDYLDFWTALDYTWTELPGLNYVSEPRERA